MNGLAIIFLLLACGALLALPRRWAPLPLLAGACYMTLGQGIQVGPFHFPIIRIVLLVGVIRVLCRGEGLAGGLNGLDWLVLAWGASALCISVQPWVGRFRSGLQRSGDLFSDPHLLPEFGRPCAPGKNPGGRAAPGGAQDDT